MRFKTQQPRGIGKHRMRVRPGEALAGQQFQKLLGAPPSFLPNDIEAVWQIAEHGFVFIEVKPEVAGAARHLLFVNDLDGLVATIAHRGLEPAKREILSNGVRKVTYRDLDGNEMEFGGA